MAAETIASAERVAQHLRERFTKAYRAWCGHHKGKAARTAARNGGGVVEWVVADCAICAGPVGPMQSGVMATRCPYASTHSRPGRHHHGPLLTNKKTHDSPFRAFLDLVERRTMRSPPGGD